MPESQLFDPIQILHGSNQPLKIEAVLIVDGKIKAFGKDARQRGKNLNLDPINAKDKLIAPCLVDPHSVLEEPFTGRSETLKSLRGKAAKAGYGQLALLPKSQLWRDKPEALQGFNDPNSSVYIHLWGSFSMGGEGKELSPHSDLLQHGAIGLAEDDFLPPLELLKKGLLLEELNGSPLLLAPRDIKIQGKGMVREGIETFRAGWVADPIESETLPLFSLLELHRRHPNTLLRLMNLSTSDSVLILSNCTTRPMASVSWWHLVSDRSNLAPDDLGWRVTPSIGSAKDRESLIQALFDGVITAVSVHAIPLDEEETKLPPDQRKAGLCGHNLVLPSLWEELIVKSGWSIEQLWEVLSFGPSRMLSLEEEKLSLESNRWIVFDPNKSWRHSLDNKTFPFAANQPCVGKTFIGKVTSTGLIS